MPKISIVTSVYNTKDKWLRETFQDFKIKTENDVVK